MKKWDPYTYIYIWFYLGMPNGPIKVAFLFFFLFSFLLGDILATWQPQKIPCQNIVGYFFCFKNSTCVSKQPVAKFG